MCDPLFLCSRVIASAFKNYVLDTKEIRTPVKTLGGATFFHIMEGDLFVVAIVRDNANAALVFELLHRTVETFKSYFKTIDEGSIRSNFVLIYELLDEIIDFGHPQLSSKVCFLCVLRGETLSAGGAAEHHHAGKGAVRL